MTRKPALLALEDGSLFWGENVGADGETVGEVVFNTAMTGYQEILSDPSYARQIVTLTHPHIGNTGCNLSDMESRRPFVAGLLVRDLSLRPASWRNEESLPAFLERHGVVAMAELDTRRLTRLLRDKGAQNGCIVSGAKPDAEYALSQARAFPGLESMDLARDVSVSRRYEWRDGSYDLEHAAFDQADAAAEFHVVAYDFGLKHNILRMLVDCGCRVTVVPATTPAGEILAMEPDGVMLTNGPGDPKACTYAIAATRKLINSRVPLFGICLGHQLLALAAGAKTVKMKFGHHGANHPVSDLDTGRVLISSQNHGFAVDESTLPDNARVTHRSLFDGSLQGIALTDAPAFSFQGHPEASPGPHDLKPLFEEFVSLMRRSEGAVDHA